MAEVFTSKQKFGFGLMRLPLTNPDDGGSIDLEETIVGHVSPLGQEASLAVCCRTRKR